MRVSMRSQSGDNWVMFTYERLPRASGGTRVAVTLYAPYCSERQTSFMVAVDMCNPRLKFKHMMHMYSAKPWVQTYLRYAFSAA